MTIEPKEQSTKQTLLKHISQRAQNRKLFSFGGLPIPETIETHKSPISLAGGRPHAEFFPINEMSIEISNGPFDSTSSEDDYDYKNKGGSAGNGKKNKALVKKFDKSTLDISNGLQYGPTEGHIELINFAKNLIKNVNKPKYDSWDLIFTNGTGDSLHKVFNLLINPGDVILVECYTYVPVMSNIVNYGGIVVPVKLRFDDDDDNDNDGDELSKTNGIDVFWLEDLLKNWEINYPGLKRPKAFYTIPTGQNPTGITTNDENRKFIYELSCLYDFIIIEDDPYGYIQLGKYNADDDQYNKYMSNEDGDKDEEYCLEKYINEDLPNSYLKFDIEGRVLRLESFSKVFAPGTRLGFIVGLKEFIKEISKHTLVSTRACSGISQLVLYNVLQKIGGVSGFLKWNIKISKEYTNRKNLLLETFFQSDAYLKGFFKVIEPEAGMFIMININFPTSNSSAAGDGDGENYKDQLEELRYKCLKKGVIVVLGKNMAINDEYSSKARFLRLTIASQDSADEIIEGGKRLTNAISEYFMSIK